MEQMSMKYIDRVVQALMSDPRTKDVTIDVIDEHGIVTLRGTVDREHIRQAAEEIARKQEGVITVINEIKIKAR